MMRLHRTALVLLLSATAWGQAGNVGEQPTLEKIVARVTQAQQDARAGVRPYAVTRYYELHPESKPEKASTVTAEIRFQPPSTKDYTIQETKGGDGERVVRKVLEHEREIASQWEQTAITERNYRFALAGEEVLDGHRCFVLGITPLRESKDLIRGRAWVDAEQYNLRQVAGEPAKSPSWWIKHMQVTLRYGEVQGMWLQTAASATADVRLMGRHIFTSRDMSYSTEMVAKNAIPSVQLPASRAKFPAATGTAVIVPRR
jgi:hypothetical protein